MANSDEDVLEGFLCPICMKDLSSVAQLQAHFEEEHESEDKAVLHSLKGFFNKAKKKFLNEEDEIEGSLSRRLQNPFFNEAQICEANNPWDWDTLPYIPSRSHGEIYKKVRHARIDSFVAETNKLLIRLDKLLYQIPSDPGKRKAHEKDIVPWAEDKDVPLCPFCARSFNLARRRHHCRLCGAIMCNDCSKLLSFTYAQKLVYPIRHGNTSGNDILHSNEDKSSLQSTFGTMLVGFSGLKRSGSHGSLKSLSSVMDSLGKEQCFKICAHCLARLKSRDRQVEQRSSKPLLSIYYDKLMEYRKLLIELLSQYMKMVESLSLGETTYNLKDADELRMKILRIGDTISMTAQKIRNLGAAGIAIEGQEFCNADGEKVDAGPRQGLLQKRIHSSTVGFLKDNVLGLPKLPSAGDIQKRREKRRMETDARLAAQRETARQTEERAAAMILRKKKMGEDSSRANSTVSSSSSSSSAYSTPKRRIMEEVSIDAGWLADTAAHNVIETDDPIVQQMNIIRNYIKQARDASKYDEVVLLEANLRELQLEFKSQQRLLES